MFFLKIITLVYFLTAFINLQAINEGVKNYQLAEEDKIWMNEFVDEFFLNNTMLYTLFGTKPMSGVIISIANEEECINSWQPILQKALPEQKELFLKALHKHCEMNTLPNNFTKWTEWRKKNPSSSFLFRSSVSDDKYYLLVDMINVQEALWTLKKHYSIFSKETGMEFDPMKVVLEFENSNSPFWQKVYSNSFLLGILYGFGERNAYFFSAYPRKEINVSRRDISFPFDSIGPENIVIIDNQTYLDNIGIPAFRSFPDPLAEEDPIITHFKKERKLIQEKLKDKDFTTEVLKKYFEMHDFYNGKLSSS